MPIPLRPIPLAAVLLAALLELKVGDDAGGSGSARAKSTLCTSIRSALFLMERLVNLKTPGTGLSVSLGFRMPVSIPVV